ncbi:hypothetical protein QQX98_013271, partial [Neonectria punicea]
PPVRPPRIQTPIIWARSILALAFALFAALATRFFTANDPSNRYISKNLDLLTLTSHDLSDLLQNGTVSSVQLVQEYYRRILRDDRAGFQLHSIISLAPLDKTLAIAQERDEERHASKLRGLLQGIPLIVKDNMVTDPVRGMPTTYGAYALQYSRYPLNAFVVSKAEEAGAITIAKANLVELAGTLTEVVGLSWGNGCKPDPCGSSSGSGVAVASGFAPVSLGTDTTGSVTCVADFNALYGIRPSFGLLSRTGILSTTASFDTPGILAKSAVDVAQWLDVLAQPDGRDPITVEAHKNRSPSYIEGLHQDWKRWRIGVLDRGAFWNASRAIFVTPEQDLQKLAESNDALVKMEALGATVVDDVPYPLAAESRQVLDTYSARLYHELKDNLDAYLSRLENTSIHNVKQLYKFNKANPKLAFDKGHDDQEFLEGALASNLTATELDANLALLEHYSREVNTEAILDKYNLDFVVFPGFTWMNVYNALSGNPYGVVPLGRYHNGRPFGLGFIARRFQDHELLSPMKAYEAAFPPRQIPRIFNSQSLWRYYWVRLVRPVLAIF